MIKQHRGGWQLAVAILVCCGALSTAAPAQVGGRGRGGAMRPAVLVERINQALHGIDLSQAQRQQIDAVLATGRQQMRGAFQQMGAAEPAARRGRMMEMSDDLADKVRAVLSPEQVKTFNAQLADGAAALLGNAPASQPSTAPADSPRLGVVLERLRDYLDEVELTDEQKPQIEKLFTDVRAKLRDLQSSGGDLETLSREAQTMVQQLRRQITATLTPAQLARFREVIAQNGPVNPGRRGGRAGRAGRGGQPNMQDMQGMSMNGMNNDMNDMSMGGGNAPKPAPSAAANPTPELPMLDVDAVAPDFNLKKIDNTAAELSSLKGKLVLVVFGSYSSPSFRQRAETLEAIRREYGPRITPLIIYTRENHPVGEWDVERNKDEGVAVEQPADMDGRIAIAKKARGQLKLAVPIAIDTMDDATAKAYGGFTNAAFLIGRDGKIIARQKWFEPYAMRRMIDAALKEPAKPQ
jgi:Spy/CpxP family protein refolding chaperone/peroxiredoxin